MVPLGSFSISSHQLIEGDSDSSDTVFLNTCASDLTSIDNTTDNVFTLIVIYKRLFNI